ncbi:hypothetical protein [Arthrobacter sp. H5]|uniref:hypothetical protein n=1 Tax=Arthrobacter sp. H5 TaxID=1267973 RepID=UPI0004B6F839
MSEFPHDAIIAQTDPIFAQHVQEVRRGSVVLACLSVLRGPHYGYSLLNTLSEG